MNVSKRLRGPHPARPAPEVVTTELLDAVTYDDIDMLNAIPRDATHKGYAVIGGSGFVGTHIVKLLLLRGESSIRVLDVVPPPQELLDNPAIAYVPTEITSAASVAEGLRLPFAATGAPPSVIFQCAATIRFWERAAYTWPASFRTNVLGTQHVVDAARSLPKGTSLIYTSSADVVLPTPRFLHNEVEGDDKWPYNTPVVSDADPPLPSIAESSCCYVRSKIMAENLVLKANGEDLITASLRPGQTITGPNDRMLTSTLTLPRVPVWDAEWSHTNVCVWDVAAAHLALEDALQDDSRRRDVSGEAFLITGNGPAWTMRDTRGSLKHYARRRLIFDNIHPLPPFVLAHLIEAFLFLRYFLLLPLYFLFGSRPRITPRWMSESIYLQPATLEYMRDVVIDDSRARKLFGYQPQWSTAQTIKYTVDQIESGVASGEHGLKLK